MKPLISSRGIPQTYLRLSITDRCNLRCTYCMPPAGRKLVSHDDLLTYEDLLRLSALLIGMGIRKIRVTGGEPLVRRGIVEFLGELSAIDPGIELCLTTNGTLLERHSSDLRAAGVKRINVSIDSLRDDTFYEITRGGSLGDVLRGLEAASKAGFEKIKLNTVLFRDLNGDEAPGFVRFSREHGFVQRFIELMPFRMSASNGVTERDVREKLKQAGIGTGGVEFISQLTHPFCRDCGRLRIDSRGRMKTCLISGHHLDLKKLLRGGAGDTALADEIGKFVEAGEKRLAEDPDRWENDAKSVSMSEVGG